MNTITLNIMVWSGAGPIIHIATNHIVSIAINTATHANNKAVGGSVVMTTSGVGVTVKQTPDEILAMIRKQESRI